MELASKTPRLKLSQSADSHKILAIYLQVHQFHKHIIYYLLTAMLVISIKFGQIGNRLQVFANYIAFAIENNMTVLNPAFDEYAEFFESTSKDLLCCYPSPAFKIKGNKWSRSKYYQFTRYLVDSKNFKVINITREKPFNWSDSPVAEEVKTRSINLMQGWILGDGWFARDTALLRKHGDAVREYFKPLKKYRLNVSNLMYNIRQSADIIVGLHIRQGDYQKHQKGRYFYKTEDYIKVMRGVKELFPAKNVKFLICSNVKQDESLLTEFKYCFGNNHIIEDMYALAECDYIMGPPSSYTMWASFYGDKSLYRILDINKTPSLNDFLHFYNWQGIFHDREDWSKSYWEWKN